MLLLSEDAPGLFGFCSLLEDIMRHLSIAAIVAASTVALMQTASAADLRVKAPPPPAPIHIWSGFYAGLNVGGGWGSTIDNSAATVSCVGNPASFCPAFAAAVPGRFDTRPSGFIGGGQIGYNYQTGAFVWSVETDLQGAHISGSETAANTVVAGPPAPVTLSGTGSQKLDLFGTLRGRVGWAPISPLLIYATGGLAYGHTQTDVSFSQFVVGGAPASVSPIAASSSRIQAGWTIGGGMEWMFAPRWSVKGEYLYYDLGDVTLNQTQVAFPPGVTGVIAIQSVAHYQGNIARIGLNYKFD